MSKAEVERFVSDLEADANLQSEVRAKAAGIPSLIEAATAREYEITGEDIRHHAHSQGQERAEATFADFWHGNSSLVRWAKARAHADKFTQYAQA